MHRLSKRNGIFIISFMASLYACQAFAWENHAMLTTIVLNHWASTDPIIAEHLNQPVSPEPLAVFLKETQASLPTKLQSIEQWARKNESGYQALPDELSYQPTKTNCAKNLVVCFKKAIRINLDVPLNPIIYDPSSYYVRQFHFSKLNNIQQLVPSYIPSQENPTNYDFIPTPARVKTSDIIATSTIQPDFGFDTFLYTNNQTAFGKIYHFGTQPLGDPSQPYNSQMLFHMSAYHEDPSITALMPRLSENYPEYRAYLYLTLARFAADNNHPYWAAVFLGWGLHYIQDMTQPYHTKMSYGLDPTIVVKALIEAAKKNYLPLIQLQNIQTNRHVILEELSSKLTIANIDNQQDKDIIFKSLTDKNMNNPLPVCDFTKLFMRNDMVVKIGNLTPDYQQVLQADLPSNDINNPLVNGQALDFNKLLTQDMTQTQRIQFSKAIAKTLYWFSAYTKACVQANYY